MATIEEVCNVLYMQQTTQTPKPRRKPRKNMSESAMLKSHLKQVFSDKEKSVSLQILERYLQNRDKHGLLGVSLKDIRMNKETTEFIEKNNLVVTNGMVK
jgi:hypothetical protein